MSVTKLATVEAVASTSVSARLTRFSACTNCHSESLCPSSEVKEDLITIPKTDDLSDVKVGDRLILEIKKQEIFWATTVAYVFPLLTFVLVLLVGVFVLHWTESISALVAILGVLFYFLTLHFFRNNIEHFFSYTVVKERL